MQKSVKNTLHNDIFDLFLSIFASATKDIKATIVKNIEKHSAKATFCTLNEPISIKLILIEIHESHAFL